MNQTDQAVQAWVESREELDETIGELNDAIGHLEKKDVLIHVLEARCDSMGDLLNQQCEVIERCIEERTSHMNTLGMVRAQLRELQKLDPKRLAKVNEGLKKTIERLKAKK